MGGSDVDYEIHRIRTQLPMPPTPPVSAAFHVFFTEAPAHARAWMTAVEELGRASALDAKTSSLAYRAVLAALRLESGVPFHVGLAKSAGASRAEVLSAILVGLPAAGNTVVNHESDAQSQ